MTRMITWPAVMLCMICIPAYAKADTLVELGRNATVERGQEVDSAVSLGGDVRVDGLVRNDVVAVGGSVFLGPGSIIKGNIVSLGGTVVKEQGASVLGDITVIDPSRIKSFIMPGNDHWRDMPYGFHTPFSIFPFIGFLALALITVAIAPRAIGYISFTIEHALLKTFFLGILGSASIFPVAFMLLISIIGIILIPFEMLLVGIAFFIGYVAVVQLIGKKLFLALKMPDRPMLLETLAGTVAISLAGMAPFVGRLFTACALIIGFGGVIAGLVNRLLWKHKSGSAGS